MVAWIDGIIARLGLTADTAHALHLRLEEAVCNVVAYAFEPDASHDVHIALWRDADALHADVTDDGRPFDPLSQALPGASEGSAVRSDRRAGHQADPEFRCRRALSAIRRDEPVAAVLPVQLNV